MFSIIIPTYNNINYLKICIDSLKKNSHLNNQIIVHVNQGLDETRKYLDSNNIEYTYSKDNVGLCKGVNLASLKAKHDYILYSHDDFYFCPNWDKFIFDEIKKIGHNNFYLSGTMFDTIDEKKFFCGDNYKNFDEKKLLKNFKRFKSCNIQGSNWAPHVVHKSLWKKINGFSEEYFPGAGSDPDFNMKLWKVNVRIFKGLGNSLVYHFGSKTLREKISHNLIKNSGSKSGKIFLKKWKISIKFFKKYYLRSGQNYTDILENPKISFAYLIDILKCKINYLFLILFTPKI